MERIGKRIVMVVVAVCVLSSVVLAETPQNKKFGIGIVIGTPTGFSLKHWESSRYAIQGAVGAWSGGLTVGADYLIHTNAFNKSNVPFYYGPGLFFGSAGFGGPRYEKGDVALGGRFMFGVDYIVPGHPFDIAFEVGPALLLTPSVGVGLEVGIAFRFYP